MTEKATPDTEPVPSVPPGEAEVIPIRKARRSRDYSQRAYDVVQESIRRHDPDAAK